jgi:ethanolamine ammonia-lyase small subunit
LRAFTAARVELGTTGVSVRTRDALAFTLAHAQARDAVHARLDVGGVVAGIARLGLRAVVVRSAARDRAEYLRRPDLGRRLDEGSVAELRAGGGVAGEGLRLTVMVGDGLSAVAVERNAVGVIAGLLEGLAGWALTEVVVATQARVALGDAVGEALGSDATVMLIGERPGLSAADSLGAYLTWRPRVGATDAERNCVSNIREGGLEARAAGRRIALLLGEAKRLGMSGVGLKDPEELGLLE